MLKFVALDPGITTGFSLAIIEQSTLFISCDQEKFSHRNLYDFLTEIAPDHVICESFEYRNTRHRDNLELYSLEMIGIVKLYCEPVMQHAAKGKGFYTDEKLKKLDLYVPGKQHGRDAMRHLLHWYTFGPGYIYNPKGSKMMLAQFETLLEKGDADNTVSKH
jgi:hypothetical protein